MTQKSHLSEMYSNAGNAEDETSSDATPDDRPSVNRPKRHTDPHELIPSDRRPDIFVDLREGNDENPDNPNKSTSSQ